MFLNCNTDENDDKCERSFVKEAERSVKEIEFGVKYAQVSNILEKNDLIAFINIRSLEDQMCCVELNLGGYLIVSREFDTIDKNLREENILKRKNHYETIESLMFNFSPMFAKIFNELVCEKLKFY
ncbi:unnamed protein product [Brachionus calyciflorus]|uniref:GSKIP domain-containing protein n=1 Tax=Brachionus calyciflorus TaxID=104777 RepID=A0A813Q5S0_9BILA|nr:unnamed protein product [Brachionus calyciflorus]